MSIEEQLEIYADLSERIEQLNKMRDELLEKAVPDEVKKALEVIKLDWAIAVDPLMESLSEIRKAIEQNILTIGETVRGSRIMAVWNKGRSSWDGKALDGFAMAHPEILQAKKIGDPTVTFREVKK